MICALVTQLIPMHVFAKGAPGSGGGGIERVPESCRKPAMFARRSVALKQVAAAEIRDKRIANRDVQLMKAEVMREGFIKAISGGGRGGICVCTEFACSVNCDKRTTAEIEREARNYQFSALARIKDLEKKYGTPQVLAAIEDFRATINAASSTRTAAILALRTSLHNGYDSGLAVRLGEITTLKNTRLTAVNNAYTAWQGRCATPPSGDDTTFVSSVASAKKLYDSDVYDARKSHLSSMTEAYQEYLTDIWEVTLTYIDAISAAFRRVSCIAETNNPEECSLTPEPEY